MEVAAIPGGAGMLGTATPLLPQDGACPLRRKQVKPFRLGETTVTNAQFQGFAEATGHLTETERNGDSLVFRG